MKPAWEHSDWSVGQVFDYLQRELGIGYYDEDFELEYFEWRSRQVGQLKHMMKRRHLTPGEMVVACDYCKAKRLAPTTFQGVAAWLTEALKWRAQETEINLERDILLAVACERSRRHGDNNMCQRLLAAQGDAREGVLNEWRQQQESSRSR